MVAFFPAWAPLARADSGSPPKILGVRVGIADRYKAGLWTQVDVALEGGGEPFAGELAVVAPDADGVPGRASVPCRLRPGEMATVRAITRFGRVDGSLAVELRDQHNVVVQRTFDAGEHADAQHFLPALESQSLFLVVGESTLGIEDAVKLGRSSNDARAVVARVADVERLPTDGCAYEGVDVIVLATSRPEIVRRLAADRARLEALDRWVWMGGRLVLAVGSNAQEVLAKGSPLGRFAPGRLAGMVSLRQTGALETYCGSRTAVFHGEGKTSVRTPRLVDVDGAIEAAEADLPLVVRRARGFGQVIFVAADLDRPPVRDWPDRPWLMAKLLDLPGEHGEESGENAAMMHQGYDDMAGQLRSALDRFDGVDLAPFWLVAALVIVYILLIGPGDYFFLRRFGRRMEWTWLTFPLIIVLVCAGAYALAHRMKGNRVRVHQVDLVDVDVASNRLRGATWLDVFSPRMEMFNVAVRPRRLGENQAPADARVWMAWLGLPGASLGGMSSRAAGPLPWTEEFLYARRLDALSRVPIQVWSTKSFTARWTMAVESPIVADLSESDQLLTGAITNALPFPLEKCILAHGRSVYELGTLGPGESARLGTMTKRSELRTMLTGRRVVFTEGTKQQEEVTPYDQASTDAAYILRTMMFYDAAGGRAYTGLWNDYQDFVDLSLLLKTGRAILVAQGPASGRGDKAAELLRDGQPVDDSGAKHVVFYRFVLPVKTSQ